MSGKRPLQRRRAYTTGQVALAAGCASRTVQKLFDAGVIKGYRIPGGNDRRIPHDDLMAFLRGHGIRIPRELEEPRVLLVASVFGLGQLLEARGFAVAHAATGFDAGRIVMERRPCAAMVCLSLVGRSEGIALARRLQACGVPVLALATEDGSDAHGLAGGPFAGVLEWGTAPERMAEALASLAAETEG